MIINSSKFNKILGFQDSRDEEKDSDESFPDNYSNISLKRKIMNPKPNSNEVLLARLNCI